MSNEEKNEEENENKSLEKSSDRVPMKIDLGPAGTLDLSYLPAKEREALMVEHTKNMMDLQKKHGELNVESNILKKNLDGFTETAKENNENEVSAIITNTLTNKMGRTEVMIGNTEQAQKGKFSNSQEGGKDFTPYYIFGGILALVLIFALMKN